ncbi:hypothetical protein [Trinickia sp. EG282A]|uniref:hypothetical protein n=1 Tax=Trinickia sp. EG282A TaxID=3237013 RepID=UPI0034D23D34
MPVMERPSGRNLLKALDPPVLPDILDLQDPDIAAQGAVEVNIPFYSQRNWGDRIMLQFSPALGETLPQVRRYYYLAVPNELTYGKTLPVYVAPLWALQDGTYNVSYVLADRAENMSTSPAKSVTVKNAPAAPVAGSVQTSFFGTYSGGLTAEPIESWIVASDYDLPLDASGILLRSLDDQASVSTIGAKLGLYLAGSERPFVTLSCQRDGNWSIEPEPGVSSPMRLSRGDMVSIMHESSQPERIYLALTL